ncbi:MAG: 50S ribosomal protein L11 methyltransferase [Lachnospiraceae bacterium]|nr:50S ribosomal protein L11 methyltransferase [Lachnospiraceae bacterium]
MKWIVFNVKTTKEAEDIVISSLYDLGLEGAEVEDQAPLDEKDAELMFVDILPETGEDDGTAHLRFFAEEVKTERNDGKDDEPRVLIEGEERPVQDVLRDIENELAALREFNLDIGEGTVTVEETEDLDWVNNWKQYFHTFRVDDVLIVPSWEEENLTEEAGYLLRIDPGTAFGTGAHETTKLCIRALRKYVKSGDRILDVGTGSGILGILSLMFGASAVLGTDLDPCAITATEENKKKNGIADEDFEVLIGNIISDPGVQERAGTEAFDIVTANILTEVLLPLTPVIAPCLKKGGLYITSGIIEGKEGLVRDAMEKAGFEVTEEKAEGEWRSVVGRKL